MSQRIRATAAMCALSLGSLMVSVLALVLAFVLPGTAHAQVPTLDPSGRVSNAPAPAPTPAPAPQPTYILPGGTPQEGSVAPEEEDGFYHYDKMAQSPEEEASLANRGPVPERHVVQQGDTLWDICELYFRNAWEWPRIWSYNASITNPHWIYPGDLVRLYQVNEKPRLATVVNTEEEDPLGGPVTQLASGSRTHVALRQLAFVELDDLQMSYEIVGSEEPRVLLSTGDVVYLSYPDGKPPQKGQRYAVYSESSEVRHPDTGELLGAYIRISGELEVVSIKKDKRARAVVTESMGVIERGRKVGPVRRTFRKVSSARNAASARGTIVAKIDRADLIGQRRLVFIDLAEPAKIAAGNRLYVIRRGDAMPVAPDDEGVGRDDRRFPSYAVGEMVVIQVGKATSVAMVTLAVQEIEVGDKVLMRKSR